MQQDYDLGQLLEAIRERESRLGRDGVGAALGMKMVKAARDFVRLPSEASLRVFEQIEAEWRSSHQKARHRYSSDFRGALGIATGALRPNSYAGNTPYNKDWNPARGFVYGFWSQDMYGLVKLGATTTHPSVRMTNFKRDYKLQHLEIIFFFEVALPAKVEQHWTGYLKTYRRSVGRHGSREWYELTPGAAMHHVRSSIESTQVSKLPLQYVFKNISNWREIDFWPQGQRRFGAHIVPAGAKDS